MAFHRTAAQQKSDMYCNQVFISGIHHVAENCMYWQGFWCATRKPTEAVYCCKSGFHLDRALSCDSADSVHYLE